MSMQPATRGPRKFKLHDGRRRGQKPPRPRQKGIVPPLDPGTLPPLPVVIPPR